MPKQTAVDLVNLLKLRHSKDVLVEKCKTGDSLSSGFRQMDVWVCRSSYTRPAFIAYEIKVSRSDFLRDVKWRDYLDYCTEFYFVCPRGLIDPKELPDEAGLLWASSTGSRLFSKKKAPMRAVDPPIELFMYVLISRCKITRDRYDGETSIDYWRRWLAQREEKQDIGARVSRRLSEIDSARYVELNLLRAQIKGYDAVKIVLDELGVSVTDWHLRETIRARFKGLHPDIQRKLSRIEALASEAIGLMDGQGDI